MEEIWETINGIETHEVSNFGRVRSKDRVSTVTANGIGGHPGIAVYARKLKGKLLSLKKIFEGDKKSYVYASINDQSFLVHRLVANAFLPKIGGKDFVNHIDGDKHNNRVDNLEWCSCSENEKHSYSVLGKVPWNKGIHYDTTNAVKVRNTNHLRYCKLLLQEWRDGVSKKQLALKYNRCYRQICDNINKAIKAESEVQYE